MYPHQVGYLFNAAADKAMARLACLVDKSSVSVGWPFYGSQRFVGNK
jgi:hypothetical protein